ncbi:unnamed protein product [Adineta ricciae]|uniref:SH3 domain-containing protein n=1 Tax=Adineta ricciae TaxID=249248 RepID=A0A814IZT9_ADIRI|nr:unnamed protein product [Adineta ricciae]
MGSSYKTTDIQITQAIRRFEEENEKVNRFKHEFEKYIQAKLLFENASNRFLDFLCSLNDSSTWSQQRKLIQTNHEIGRNLTENIRQLQGQIVLTLNTAMNYCTSMQAYVHNQKEVQRGHDKKNRQYQSSIKHKDQMKIDQDKNELDQLRSALDLANDDIRQELPKFHQNLQNQFIEIIKDVFYINGKFYKKTYKSYSHLTKSLRGDVSINGHKIGNDSKLDMYSSISDYHTKNERSSTLTRATKRTDYKVLHRARVIHDYKAENNDELDLTKDTVISVISWENEADNVCDRGWEYAQKSDGTVGLFPVNFATRIYENEEQGE